MDLPRAQCHHSITSGASFRQWDSQNLNRRGDRHDHKQAKACIPEPDRKARTPEFFPLVVEHKAGRKGSTPFRTLSPDLFDEPGTGSAAAI